MRPGQGTAEDTAQGAAACGAGHGPGGPAAVHGPDGRVLTAAEADALMGDPSRIVARDQVRIRPDLDDDPPRACVSTAFMVEPAGLTEAQGGPWETLVTDEPRGDEVLRLRWPDRETAELAHAVVCRSVETTNLHEVVTRLRDQARAQVGTLVHGALAAERGLARRAGGQTR